MKNNIPNSVRATLWSYDVDSMNTDRDKVLIITQVLNYGTMDAVEWLNNTYKRSDITECIHSPLPGMWNKKSLNLWSLIFAHPAVIAQ